MACRVIISLVGPESNAGLSVFFRDNGADGGQRPAQVGIGHLPDRKILLGGQCGGAACGLPHGHAGGLHPEGAVGVGIRADASSGAQKAAGGLGNQGAVGHPGDDAVCQEGLPDAVGDVQIYGIEA